MNLPSLIELSDFEASAYIDEVFRIFNDDVVNGNLSFLGLPIKCPWHPPYDNKHFCFWHLISKKQESNREEDRIPDMQRCERISWIRFVIQNSNDKDLVWCWEKSIKTKRGRNSHIHLYLHKERYLVILRRKNNRLELVTTFIVNNHKRREREYKKENDPR
jgi:hypothetical protein